MADQSPSNSHTTCSPREEAEQVVRFSPEEEAKLLHESNAHKASANSIYLHGNYHQALDIYAKASDICPNYLDYELALLQTNIAACYLKLSEWRSAITAATNSLDRLDKLDTNTTLDAQAAQDALSSKDHEIVSPDASRRQSDAKRIRYKALMRRARARSELGGWQNLDGAHADYTSLQSMDNLTREDRRLVTAQLTVLPTRVKEAKDKEVAQMWNQLKQLGNGMLKPFGLSTDNFQMQQDPKTGGYSMNMKSG